MVSNELSLKNILVAVNGSRFCSSAFNFAFKELRKDKDILHVVHIKIKDQSGLPFNKQAQTIQSEYETKLYSSLIKELYTLNVFDEEKQENTKLFQIYQFCEKKKVEMIVVGFQGNKERPKSEITKNIRFILTSVRIPVFIMKEYIPRNEKKSKCFSWLICIDANNSRGWQSFLQVIKVIHSEDIVTCFHIKTNKKSEENIQEAFFEICKENGITKTSFVLKENEKTIGDTIVNYINYSDDTPDYVILGHSNEYIDIMSSPAAIVLQKAQTNLFFYSK